MSTFQCPACHRVCEPDDKFCSRCGTKLAAASAKQQNPASSSSTQQSRPDGNWQAYENKWHGFTLEKPANWTVHISKGVTTISEDTERLVCVVIRLLQLQKPIPVKTLARHLVGAMQRILPTLTAWEASVQGDMPEDENTLVMHIQATYKNVPLVGTFIIQVRDTIAIVNGIQAPANRMQQMRSTLQHILTSLRFIDQLPLQKYTESNEGAFSGHVPQGWKVRAILHRTMDSSRVPLTEFRATDSTGTINLEVPPQYNQYTTNPMMAMVPGPIRFMPVQSAQQYIKQFLLPQIRRSRTGVQIEAIVSHPDMAQESTAKAAKTDQFNLGTICDIASVQYSFTNNGTTYRAKDFVEISHIRAVGTWTARIMWMMKAPAAQFTAQEPIFMGIIESVQFNPRWQQQEQARSDHMFIQAHGRLVRTQQQYVAAAQHLHQTELNIAHDIQAGVERRNAAFSALQNDMDRIIAGRTYMFDPIDQKVYDVDVAAGSYWAGDGYVYRNPSGNNQAPKLGLHRLDPL